MFLNYQQHLLCDKQSISGTQLLHTYWIENGFFYFRASKKK